MTVGKSEYTPYKQECFKKILETNVNICYSIFRKYDSFIEDKTYYFLDFTAGNMDLNEETSPKSFLETMLKSHPMSFKAGFFEKNNEEFGKLQKNMSCWVDNIEKDYIKTRFYNSLNLYNQNIKSFPELLIENKNKFGMAYYDPNGVGDNSTLAFLSEFTYCTPKIDILLNISPLMLKRLRSKNSKENFPYTTSTISELLNKFYKKNWWIRMPRTEKDKWQWVMLFGTNNPNFEMPRLDFHSTTSLLGGHLVDKYDDFIAKNKNPETLFTT